MRIFTGLQPSGALHIGNYFGAIKPMLARQSDANNEMIMFIADFHAMTSCLQTQASAAELRGNIRACAAAFLALGIDPNRTIFYLQSDVPEVLELYWLLSQHTPMGLLERAHSYKDKTAKGLAASHGLFSYPVLMAADILLFDAERVPVGKDQVQHLEITRDIAGKFNNEFGEIFVLPQAIVDEQLQTITGTDGAKMSKSYGNVINIFESEKKIKKQINSIASDSTPLEAPKDWANCNIYKIAELFMTAEQATALRARYERGGEGYGHFKAYLSELVLGEFAAARARYEQLLATNEIEEILAAGAAKARKIAQAKMAAVKEAIFK